MTARRRLQTRRLRLGGLSPAVHNARVAERKRWATLFPLSRRFAAVFRRAANSFARMGSAASIAGRQITAFSGTLQQHLDLERSHSLRPPHHYDF